MNFDLEGVQRAAYGLPSLLLGRRRGIQVERWLRGREEVRTLLRSDAVVASFGNSGRTWLRVMLSYAFKADQGLTSSQIIDRDNLKKLSASIPAIFFTHDNYIRDYVGQGSSKAVFGRKPVIFLARHPADIAVSQYHQWKYRMRHRKKVINDYPTQADMSLSDFVMKSDAGLSKIISYMNEWANGVDDLPHAMILRYEDLKENTVAELQRVFDFLDYEIDVNNITDAVEASSLERMRQLEKSGSPLVASGRLFKDRTTADSFKARRGKARGYTEDFSAEDLAVLEGLIRTKLNSRFGYSSP